MPNKLTDAEVKKALECCTTAQCLKCKLYDTGNANCVGTILINALDLINRYEEEKKILTKKNSNLTSLQNNLTSAKAEVENYKQIAEHQQSVTLDRGFEIKRLKKEIKRLKEENKHYAELEQGCYVTGVKTSKPKHIRSLRNY